MIRPAGLVVSSLVLMGWAGLSAASGAEAQLPVAKWLSEGYEIKAAFSDNSGGAYLVLEKGTSAYLCHSSPNQVCEKLN